MSISQSEGGSHGTSPDFCDFIPLNDAIAAQRQSYSVSFGRSHSNLNRLKTKDFSIIIHCPTNASKQFHHCTPAPHPLYHCTSALYHRTPTPYHRTHTLYHCTVPVFKKNIAKKHSNFYRNCYVFLVFCNGFFLKTGTVQGYGGGVQGVQWVQPTGTWVQSTSTWVQLVGTWVQLDGTWVKLACTSPCAPCMW